MNPVLHNISTTGNAWFYRLLMWREKHIKEKNFVLFLALIVGIVCGFAALAFKWLIHYISSSLLLNIDITGGNYLYLVYPLIGILIVSCYVRYVVRDDISHGVTKVLFAISQNKSRLKPHNCYTSVVAASITIGFGGSVGSEGPIVYTGSAIGSTLGQMFRLSPRLLMILVGCGAAAGVAGIFKAPLSGALFTLEVLMLDLTTVSVMPLLISSVSAASVAYIFTGYDVQFFFTQSENFLTVRI
ncbi:MAG: chloride channel protein, partial [Muribaculum intestinale]|nr:chloride channel protein [Muribaculum intestinale]